MQCLGLGDEIQQAGNARILSILSAQSETQGNWTEHGHSLLLTFSDAGSTPAASTNNYLFDFLILKGHLGWFAYGLRVDAGLSAFGGFVRP